MVTAMTTQGQGAPGGQYESQQLAADRTLRGLQAEARDLGRQLRDAIDQRHALEKQLSGANAREVEVVTQQLARVDASIGQIESNLASVAARIAQVRLANPPHVGFPNFPGNGPAMNGREISIVSVVFTLAVLMPLSLALARRLFTRAPRQAPQPMIDPMANARLERLEQSMDAIAIEIERISEGQRFVTKVLTERPVKTAASTGPDASTLDEGKPFLALGAGPMETIRAPERQGVRQSITPH